MLTKDQLENYELNHEHGGNGLYLCEDIDSDYCRCVQVSGDTSFGSRAFLTAKDRLTVHNGTPVPTAYIERIQKLRADLKSGKMAVFHTHIMSASRAKAMRHAHENL